MLRTPRRPLSPKLLPQVTDTRGITGSDIDRAADALLREGERPTIERIRARLSRGSPNTINPLFDAWWKRLAGRLELAPQRCIDSRNRFSWRRKACGCRPSKKHAGEPPRNRAQERRHWPRTARTWRSDPTCCRSARAN